MTLSERGTTVLKQGKEIRTKGFDRKNDLILTILNYGHSNNIGINEATIKSLKIPRIKEGTKQVGEAVFEALETENQELIYNALQKLYDKIKDLKPTPPETDRYVNTIRL